jgi:hypothetical protein
MPEHSRAVICHMFIEWMACRLALPSNLASRCLRSISGRSRRSAPSCCNRSKAYSNASGPRRLLRNARKSDIPSSPAITTSPSIRNECASRRAATSTMEGKRSAQSLPLRVKQRTRAPSLRTISRYPSCLISWTHSEPEGGRDTFDGRHGLMKPEGRRKTTEDRRFRLRRWFQGVLTSLYIRKSA